MKRHAKSPSFQVIMFILTCLLTGAVSAQQRQPTTGFQGANSYFSSGLDAVNVNNGNVVFNLPLASLPKGRGTSPGAVVTLQYNSKLFKSRQTTITSYNPAESNLEVTNEGGVIYQQGGFPVGSGLDYSYYTDKIEGSDFGGWRVAYNYRVITTNRMTLESPDPCLRGDPVDKLSAKWKIEIAFPDGSIREFVPLSGASIQLDGYFNVDYNGRRYNTALQTSENNTCVVGQSQTQEVTTGMNYVTTDGSRIRLFIPYVPNQQVGDSVLPTRNWKLHFMDGTTVENKPADDATVGQRVIDPNGNKIEYKGNQIIDQLGRSITINQNSVVTTGVNGETLTTQLVWGSRWIFRKYMAISFDQMVPSGVDRYVEESHGIATLEQIILPAQAGGLSFLFDYYADTTQPNGSSYTNGWGELKSVTNPGGAKSTFTYQIEPVGQFPTATEILGSEVTEKALAYFEEYDGAQTLKTDKTFYNIAPTQSIITGSDGSVRSDTRLSYPYQSWNNGLSIGSVNPDGSFVENKWQCNTPGTPPTWGTCPDPYIKSTFTTIRDSLGQPFLTAMKDFSYDQNGNLLQTKEYDWVPYSSVPRTNGVSIPAGAIPVRITSIEYYNPSFPIGNTSTSTNNYTNPNSPKIKNLPKSTTLTDGNNNVVSRSELFYDDPNNKGNLIETRTWDSSKGAFSSPLNSGNSVSVFVQYDTYGNPVQTTDAKGIISTATYGSIPTPAGSVSGLYPTQTTTAQGTPQQRTSASTYDFHTGLVKTSTDVDNGVTNETVYDSIGRPLVQKAAINTPNEVWTQTEYNDQLRRVVVKSDLFVKGDAKKVAVQHFDQLGRVRLSRTLEDAATQNPYNEADGIKVQTRYRYDNGANPTTSNGTFTLQSNPYRTGSEPEMGWTVSYSDKTGKTSTTKTYSGGSLPAPWGGNANITGTVLNQIDANTSTVTDPAGKQRRSISNGLGQLVRVDEPNDAGSLGTVSAPVQATSYLYDTLNNLVQVNQGVQQRNFSYNSLGRLLTATNPESGTISYGYDNNGNLTQKTDARGVVTTYVYDNINRVVSRSYSDGTPAVSYTYENATIPFSKGRLTKVSSSISETRYNQFDNLGRVLSSTQITDGQTYNFGYQYNLSSTLVAQTYPSGRVVSNVLENDGDLAQVNGSFQNQSKTYVGNLTYTSAGAVTNLQLGNGKWENTVFNSRLQPIQIGLGNSQNTQELWKVNYDYGTTDNNGNIKGQTITVPGQFTAVQNYTYDSLNRLKSATETIGGSQTWKQTFLFDRYGNRNFDPAQTTTLGNCPANVCNPAINAANNRIVGQVFDNAGNTTVDAEGRQFFYDGENKQKEVRNAQNQIIGQYLYDGDGKRVKKLAANDTTIFVYDAGGRLSAEYLITTAYKPGPNHQLPDKRYSGFPRVTTDATGNVVSRRDFRPYGEEIYRPNQGTDKVRQKFTSYERDNETELDFAQARMYSSKLGRFTIPDPLLESGRAPDPQSWLRYGYAGNNPLINVDPTGLDWVRTSEKGANGNYTYSDLYGKALEQALAGGQHTRVDFGQAQSSFIMRDGVAIYEMFARGGGREVQTPSGPSNISKLATSISMHAKIKGIIVGAVAATGVAIGSGVGLAMTATGAAVGGTVTTLGLANSGTAVTTATTAATVAATNPERVSVYLSIVNKNVVQYAGITNDFARREAEHLRRTGMKIEPLMRDLTRPLARDVEQALIVIHGLSKNGNGGTLLNQINSISPRNPEYAQRLQRGYDLLKSIGYEY
jgi:RHS repeat-associated protein